MDPGADVLLVAVAGRDLTGSGEAEERVELGGHGKRAVPEGRERLRPPRAGAHDRPRIRWLTTPARSYSVFMGSLSLFRRRLWRLN